MVILGLESRPNFECSCNGQKIIVFYFCLPFQVLSPRFCPSAKQSLRNGNVVSVHCSKVFI